MRKIWLVLGAAGLSTPALASEPTVAAQTVVAQTVVLRRPAGGVLVADSTGYKAPNKGQPIKTHKAKPRPKTKSGGATGPAPKAT